MKLSALRICVDDLDVARDFYGGVLGLPLQFGGTAAGYLGFDGGAGVRVILEPVSDDAPADERAMVGRFVGASFEVDDIRAAYERLSGCGVRFVGPPERQEWGGTLATFYDPAGNQLQLVQYGT